MSRTALFLPYGIILICCLLKTAPAFSLISSASRCELRRRQSISVAFPSVVALKMRLPFGMFDASAPATNTTEIIDTKVLPRGQKHSNSTDFILADLENNENAMVMKEHLAVKSSHQQEIATNHPSSENSDISKRHAMPSQNLFGCRIDELARHRNSVGEASTISREGDQPDIARRMSVSSPIPHMNSASVFGLRPNSPAQYLIATTGERPMTFSIQDGHLPAGLHLDSTNGVIVGSTQTSGTYQVTLAATNAYGVATRPLTIKVGENIALTPPRGISTWNSCGDTITDDKIRSIAKAAERLGLRDHGYTYINIDDGWQGQRAPDGQMQSNEKFPDMQKLFRDLHQMGFHCGIYGTPWKWSYAFYPGSSVDSLPWLQRRPSFYIPGWFGWRIGDVRYEEQDAEYFASVGADFVKWDWYQNDVDSTRIMSSALRRQSRDMVFSLSNSAPLKNAKHYQALSNMVRTTADIRDVWDSHAPRDAFCLSIKEIWREHESWEPFCGPGHWTDPDMLVIGPVGWGSRTNENGDHTPFNHLTLDEQLTHMTLWVLWSAPLLIGCDLDLLDEKTLDMLCNRAALNINEDSLGKQGKTISRRGDAVVVTKPLANGDIAVGLFNTGSGMRTVNVSWKDLGLTSPNSYAVHDVWADRDTTSDQSSEGLTWEIREHSAKLFRVKSQ